MIPDAEEAARGIKKVVFGESERRGKLLADARAANTVGYNRKNPGKPDHQKNTPG